jgi:ketosteroid isomerase-like protein
MPRADQEPDESVRWPSDKETGTAGGQTVSVTRDEVLSWVSAYERAWRDGDLGAVESLFTEQATYRESPYEPSHVGHDDIRAFWLTDEGKTFTVDAAVVAVEGDTAVVRLEVRYDDPVSQEYRDLWVVRFAEDGRVADFEEWAYWPGRPFFASP